MIKPLPHWVLTNNYPAFNDVESVTAIEMVARLYGSMQELINDYNAFVDSVNEEIKDFEDGLHEDFDEFKECVMKLMNDYIESIDIKIGLQDTKIDNAIADQNNVIAEAVEYMRTNLIITVNNLFEEALRNGSITASLVEDYDSVTEELILSIEGGENNE